MNDSIGMKIAFVGDSFCSEFHPDGWDYSPNATELNKNNFDYDDQGYKAWTQLLVEHYQATAIQKGIPGDCFFHAYQRLLPVIDEADLVIICVSQPERLANRLLEPMSLWAAERGTGFLAGSDNLKTLYKASLDYYKHIFSSDFHMISHLGILRALDDLLLTKNKKCIWFGSFENSFGDVDDDSINDVIRKSLPYVVRSGVHGSCPLISIAEKTNTVDNMPKIPRSNHFNEQQSKLFLQYICGIIDKHLEKPVGKQMDFLLEGRRS